MARHISGHLSETELAMTLDISIWGLRAWRRRGYGPKWVKFGKGVFYRKEDVSAFLAAPDGGVA